MALHSNPTPIGAPGPWRLVVSPGAGVDPTPVSGATNMAVDTALLESVKEGSEPVLRLYRWSPPCLSFGRNQPARDRYDVAAARQMGIQFVRRPTGGQAVLHDRELTYAVVAPVSVVGKPQAGYRWINRVLVAALRALGVPAETAAVPTEVGAAGGVGGGPEAGGRREPRDWDAACFRRPEAGEVMAGGAKLVGSAQRVEDRVILQHGSILVGGSQDVAEALLRDPPGEGGGGWTTVERELAPVPPYVEIAGAVVRAFEEALETSLAPGVLSPAETERAEALAEQYGSEAWTWRR